MKRIDTTLSSVCILEPRVFGDARGFFMEAFNRKAFAEIGIDREFVQDNHSRSARHVLRGLHYQIGRPQAKLVRVTGGEVFDVVLDLRRGSATFGQWEGVLLSAENHRMLYVPEGFAHGFLVLSDFADFQYKCSDYYAPEEERGVLWNDPAIGIDWPLPDGAAPVLSEKDTRNPLLADVPDRDLFSIVPEGGAS